MAAFIATDCRTVVEEASLPEPEDFSSSCFDALICSEALEELTLLKRFGSDVHQNKIDLFTRGNRPAVTFVLLVKYRQCLTK